MSIHCVQYGLLLSHLTLRLRQVKQSSVAPVTGARRRRFLGIVGREPSPTGICSVVAIEDGDRVDDDIFFFEFAR